MIKERVQVLRVRFSGLQGLLPYYGLQGRPPDLIPMCHSIPVTGIDVAFKTDEESGIVEIQVTG